MKIGIISDTHDHHVNVLKAIEVFNEHKVKYVLHAGDMVSPFTANAFSAVKDAKFIAVFGNCDGEKVMLKETIESFGGEIHPQSYEGQIDGKKIFMSHITATLNALAQSGNFDLIIYGHTHNQMTSKVGKTLIINPGETTDWVTGTSTIVILETEDMNAEVIELGQIR